MRTGMINTPLHEVTTDTLTLVLGRNEDLPQEKAIIFPPITVVRYKPDKGLLVLNHQVKAIWEGKIAHEEFNRIALVFIQKILILRRFTKQGFNHAGVCDRGNGVREIGHSSSITKQTFDILNIMFTHLTDYTYTRNRKEAFGFYLAYMFLIVIAAVACSVVVARFIDTSSFDEGFNLGFEVGSIVAAIACSVLVIIILIQRKLYRSFPYLVMTLVSMVLATFGGALFGLLIPAFFTTRLEKDQ